MHRHVGPPASRCRPSKPVPYSRVLLNSQFECLRRPHARGSRFVSDSFDGSARVWPTNGTEQPFILKGYTAEIYAVAYHPSREQVATASQDTTLRLWSLEDWHRRLWRASAHCLPPLRRVILFGETDDDATAAYAACSAEVERRRGSADGFPPGDAGTQPSVPEDVPEKVLPAADTAQEPVEIEPQ